MTSFIIRIHRNLTALPDALAGFKGSLRQEGMGWRGEGKREGREKDRGGKNRALVVRGIGTQGCMRANY